MANGETRVQFSLWAVLGFILLLGAIVAGYLNAENADIRSKQRDVMERVGKVETRLEYIAEGIYELKRGQKELTDMLLRDRQRKEAAK